MSKVCHRHCPAGGSVLGGALAVVILAVVAVAVAQAVASVVQAVMVAAWVVLGVSVAAGVAVVRHMNRPVPMMRPGAESPQERRKLPPTGVHAAVSVRQRAPSLAGQVWEITDAAEGRAIERS